MFHVDYLTEWYIIMYHALKESPVPYKSIGILKKMSHFLKGHLHSKETLNIPRSPSRRPTP